MSGAARTPTPSSGRLRRGGWSFAALLVSAAAILVLVQHQGRRGIDQPLTVESERQGGASEEQAAPPPITLSTAAPVTAGGLREDLAADRSMEAQPVAETPAAGLSEVASAPPRAKNPRALEFEARFAADLQRCNLEERDFKLQLATKIENMTIAEVRARREFLELELPRIRRAAHIRADAAGDYIVIPATEVESVNEEGHFIDPDLRRSVGPLIKMYSIDRERNAYLHVIFTYDKYPEVYEAFWELNLLKSVR